MELAIQTTSNCMNASTRLSRSPPQCGSSGSLALSCWQLATMQLSFTPRSQTQIFVDETYASDGGSHSNGPTLADFAETLRSDLIHLTSLVFPPVQVTPFSEIHIDGGGSAIVLTLSPSSNHTLYSGAPTLEAYDFLISNSSYVISGSGSIGAWWGTRTLLQQLPRSQLKHGSAHGVGLGTYKPSNTSPILTNVTIQHWDFPSASIPLDLLDSGYRVINSEQAFLYLDGKIPAEGGFPQTLNVSLLFSGATAEGSAIFALWNDWGPNATTPLETYYQLSQSLAVFAEKSWAGSGIRSSELTMDQFEAAYPLLNTHAPGQNLNRAVKGKTSGDVVFVFDNLPSVPFHTGVESVGPPYTLSFSVRPSAADVQSTGDTTHTGLFKGTDSSLYASSLTFSSNAEYYSLPPAFQLKPDHWTNVTIQATREYTFATVVQEDGDTETYWYQTTLNIWGDYLTQANMSFAAPSATIGSKGFGGDIANVVLRID
ncbi:hypothetical protein HD554DRAFT_2330179 [Boletus coccyginus]|nr:hypothetical protein HD554DRAFT_2330179 [Boletus coccyginus]